MVIFCVFLCLTVPTRLLHVVGIALLVLNRGIVALRSQVDQWRRLLINSGLRVLDRSISLPLSFECHGRLRYVNLGLGRVVSTVALSDIASVSDRWFFGKARR